jgi:hypothetical protein
MQGFLFSEAVPPEEVERLLARLGPGASTDKAIRATA